MNNNRPRRTKSWFCFGPVSSTETDHDLGAVYMKVVKEDNPKKISLEKNTSEKMIVGRSQKRTPRRIFSRIAKAVFFEASLKKSRKVQQDPYHILRNMSTKYEKISDVKSSRKLLKDSKAEEEMNSKNSTMGTSSFRVSSSITSSSCSSTASSSSLSSLSERKYSKSFRSNSFEPKHNSLEDLKPKTNKKICSSSTNGLFLLLMSLMCLIFWGRVCAILCTSTWIYFSPLRRKTDDEDEEVVEKKIEKEKTESREYKKRIIMEGLLERSHSRV